MEQSFAEWTDDAEANELGLYLLDALGGILIGFGLFIIMASLANGRLRCQGIARVVTLASVCTCRISRSSHDDRY